MIDFIRKYILFPSRFGFQPYLWLMWLIIPIVQLFPYQNLKQQLALLGLIVFAWFYRNSWTVTPFINVWLVGQYIIILFLIYFQGMSFLFLFPAWVIGSLPISKAKFHQLLIIYYLAVILGIVTSMQTTNLRYDYLNTNITFQLVFLFFILLSPLGGRSVHNSYLRSNILKKQNQRYEMLIRRGERNRIARDLHDNLGQSFATITLKADLAQKLLERDLTSVKQQLTEIQTASRQNLTLVREIVSDLRQVTLTETLVSLTDKLSDLKISLITKNEQLAQKWPVVIQETIAAVLQEAITNVMQYSRADEVHIVFSQISQQALVTISDNGHGFKKMRSGAHGIMGMKERVHQIQGDFVIRSNRHGTEIQLILPLKEQTDD